MSAQPVRRPAPSAVNEIKRIISYGAKPERLGTMPIMRSRAGVADHADIFIAGIAVIKHMERSIHDIVDPVEQFGLLSSPDKYRLACKTLLGLGRYYGLPARNRRGQFICQLALPISTERLRQPAYERPICQYFDSIF
jgi:hypothetical protein